MTHILQTFDPVLNFFCIECSQHFCRSILGCLEMTFNEVSVPYRQDILKTRMTLLDCYGYS